MHPQFLIFSVWKSTSLIGNSIPGLMNSIKCWSHQLCINFSKIQIVNITVCTALVSSLHSWAAAPFLVLAAVTAPLALDYGLYFMTSVLVVPVNHPFTGFRVIVYTTIEQLHKVVVIFITIFTKILPEIWRVTKFLNFWTCAVFARSKNSSWPPCGQC